MELNDIKILWYFIRLSDKDIRKYQWKSAGLLVLGFFLLFVAEWLGFLIWFIAIGIAFGVAAIKDIWKGNDKLIDAQAALVIEDTMKNAQDIIVAKMSLDKSSQLTEKPLVFWSWNHEKYLSDVNNHFLYHHLGEDHVLRSAHVVVNIIFLSDERICTLRRYISLISDLTIDKTDEFLYDQVSGVSIDKEKINYNKEVYDQHMVVMRSEGNDFVYYTNSNTESEVVVDSIRSVLREKKV